MDKIVGKVLITAFVSLATFGVSSTEASLIDDLKAKINDISARKQQIEKEIAEYQAQVNRVSQEAKTLKGAVQTLDVSKTKITKDIDLTENKISLNQLNIQKLNVEITDKVSDLNLNKQSLAETIRSIDQHESQSLLETILAHKELSEFWTDVAEIQSFQVALQEDIEETRALKAALEEDKGEIEDHVSQLALSKKELADKKKAVEATQQEKAALLKQTQSKEAEYQKLLQQKLQQKAAFEKELFEFESQLKIAIDPSKIPEAKGGVLSWPLDNVYVTQLFGRTVDAARLYVSGTHNGVDFRAASGTKVKSAGAGVVQGVGNTDAYPGCYSYGKWVLVRHANGLSTLYAHLSVISVSSGQQVAVGETIGYSGSTGYSTGPHLHFGVYASQGVKIAQYVTSNNCKGTSIPLADPKAYLDPMTFLPR